MSVELLKSTALSDVSTYGSLSNTSYQQSEENFFSMEMGVNTPPKSGSGDHSTTTSSSVKKDLTCHCKDKKETVDDKSIKLEPWAKYKTIAMGVIVLLLVVWIAVFVPLKYKYNL